MNVEFSTNNALHVIVPFRGHCRFKPINANEENCFSGENDNGKCPSNGDHDSQLKHSLKIVIYRKSL
jgi:hypothetical protein